MLMKLRAGLTRPCVVMIVDVLGCAWLFGALTLFLWLTGVR